MKCKSTKTTVYTLTLDRAEQLWLHGLIHMAHSQDRCPARLLRKIAVIFDGTLILDEREVHCIKEMVQNPSSNNESEMDIRMRRDLFNSLKWCGDI